jgi:hypothetical protein
MAMDGILDEAAWEQAEPVGDFVFPWYEEGTKQQTVAKIVWDENYIYFAFECEDSDIRAQYYDHFGPVSRDDCCEAFICPSAVEAERLDYLNYEFNCIGTKLLGYHAKSRDLNIYWRDMKGVVVGRAFDGTCNDSTDVDTGWALEFAVPFDHFREFETTMLDGELGGPAETVEGFMADYPPVDGQTMYIGLHRCHTGPDRQYSQWSPSQTDRPNFHQPQDFGMVVFSEEELK